MKFPSPPAAASPRVRCNMWTKIRLGNGGCNFTDSRRAFFASRVGAHRCHSEIAILRTKLSGKCGVAQLVMTRRTALCVVARPDPSPGGPNGGSGSYAIRALPDLCLGIASGV